MRGEPKAIHADSNAPRNTTPINPTTEVIAGITNTTAAVPRSAPARHPAMRSVIFSTVSAVVPSDTM